MKKITLFKCPKCGWLGDRLWSQESDRIVCPACGSGAYPAPVYESKGTAGGPPSDPPSKAVSDFRPGDVVRYVPTHAQHDPNHRDCEVGVVSSLGSAGVFVRYFHVLHPATRSDNLMLRSTAQSTDPADLELLFRPLGGA